MRSRNYIKVDPDLWEGLDLAMARIDTSMLAGRHPSEDALTTMMIRYRELRKYSLLVINDHGSHPSDYAATKGATMGSDSLHPFGRCTCAGEGKCNWCRLPCGTCGKGRAFCVCEYGPSPPQIPVESSVREKEATMGELTREDLERMREKAEHCDRMYDPALQYASDVSRLVDLVEELASYVACYSDVGDEQASRILRQARALLEGGDDGE